MKRTIIISCIIVLILTISVFVFTSYSSYSSKASGTVSARVAGFILTMDENTTYFPYEFNSANPNSSTEYYKFQVTNLKNSKVSEVKEKYTLNFLITRNIPLDVAIYKVTQAKYNSATTSSADLTGATLIQNVTYPSTVNISFNNTFEANTSSTDYYIIKLTWNSSFKNDLYQDKIDLFKINASFEQV